MFCLLLPYIRLLSFIFPAQFVLVKCLSRTPVDVSQKHIKTKTFTDNHLENNNPQKNQIMQKEKKFFSFAAKCSKLPVWNQHKFPQDYLNYSKLFLQLSKSSSSAVYHCLCQKSIKSKLNVILRHDRLRMIFRKKIYFEF